MAAFDRVNEDILSRLDIQAEYSSLGVDGFGRAANGRGWLPCNAYGQSQRTPSAGINVGQDQARGRYHDFRAGLSMHLFEFAVWAGRFGSWKDSRKHYADKAGVSLGRSRQSQRADDKFDFTPWVDSLALAYLARKPGISLAALRRAGTRMGKWPKGSPQPALVMALPIFGSNLTDADPVGYLAWQRTGGMLEVWRGKGEAPDMSKTVTPRIDGAQAVWVGLDCHGVRDAELVWKVEGYSDMLALMSIMPEDLHGRHVVVTNANGCREIPNAGHLTSIEGRRVVTIHDADVPGEEGAAVWLASCAKVATACHMRLPYDIEEKSGKDLRDLITSGATYDDLLGMVEACRWFSPSDQPAIPVKAQGISPVPPPGPPREQAAVDPIVASMEAILARIQMEVVGEMESVDGSNDSPIVVHSHALRKTSVLKRVTYEALLQAGGIVFRREVAEPSGGDDDTKLRFKDVRDAIILTASNRRIQPFAQIGAGLFRGRDDNGDPNCSLLFVNRNSAFRMNGDRRLNEVTSLRVDGRIIEFSTVNDDWFSPEVLQEAIDSCGSREWQVGQIKKLDNILAQWRWSRPQADSTILTGLVMATWAQSIIPWRPWVCISGATNTGKTTLMSFLADMFGEPITFSISDTTEAGLRQSIGNKSPIILLDEFERSKRRTAIYDALRASSRGGGTARGGANQRASVTSYRHLPWLAAIELGIFREADQNRAIHFELQRLTDYSSPPNLPRGIEARRLGWNMLAMAAVNCLDAIRRYEFLKTEAAGRGLPQRLVESLGISAAFCSVGMGLSDNDSIELLRIFLGSMDTEDYSANDTDDLLADIIGSQVDLGRGDRMTVAEVLMEGGIVKGSEVDAMNRQGVGRVVVDGKPFLFILPKTQKLLLRQTRWDSEGFDICQLLRRMPGARLSRHRIAGQNCRGVLIPWTAVSEHLAPDSDY